MPAPVQTPLHRPTAIIGLGNPGRQYQYHRHSIGFRIVEALAEKYHIAWNCKEGMDVAQLAGPFGKVLLIKSRTFMNDTGAIIPGILRRGIKPEDILVVHDELDLPVGTLKARVGGSHRGHNGLKSIMARIGEGFMRLRFGIDRPVNKDAVPEYVLSPFDESQEFIEEKINEAVQMLEELINTPA